MKGYRVRDEETKRVWNDGWKRAMIGGNLEGGDS